LEKSRSGHLDGQLGLTALGTKWEQQEDKKIMETAPAQRRIYCFKRRCSLKTKKMTILSAPKRKVEQKKVRLQILFEI